MFGNIGWGEFMVLLVAALVILGPERLPGAVTWVTKSLRQVRDYASGATAQLKDELGPEFEDLRKPLSDLQQFRGMTPRTMITKHLLEGNDSLFNDLDPRKLTDSVGNSPAAPMPPIPTPARPESKALQAGERPPFDADAT